MVVVVGRNEDVGLVAYLSSTDERTYVTLELLHTLGATNVIRPAERAQHDTPKLFAACRDEIVVLQQRL